MKGVIQLSTINEEEEWITWVEELTTLLTNHMHHMGIEYIRSNIENAGNNLENHMQMIFNIQTKFWILEKVDYGSRSKFFRSIHKSCSELINNNAMIYETNKMATLPELLARFCDTLLRKKNVDEEEFERKLNQIMITYNYIEDKETFQTFYSALLAKRLLSQLSTSDDYEQAMILQLKKVTGYEYALKLNGMFNDIQLSKNLADDYRQHYETEQLDNIIDVQVMILRANLWRLSAHSVFVLPIEFKPTCDSFIDFYSRKYSGRKLTWLHERSNGELIYSVERNRYILQMSMYHMVVLLLFNRSLHWTIEQIEKETEIKLNLLSKILYSLLKNQLLRCEEFTDKNFAETDIKTNSIFQLNNDFKSKKSRFNLKKSFDFIEKKDSTCLQKKIGDDQQILIQTVIVRTMKTRQTLEYSLLVQEIIEQLRLRFTPSVQDIKRSIDLLIEKDYLEREPSQNTVLRYLV